MINFCFVKILSNLSNVLIKTLTDAVLFIAKSIVSSKFFVFVFYKMTVFNAPIVNKI